MKRFLQQRSIDVVRGNSLAFNENPHLHRNLLSLLNVASVFPHSSSGKSVSTGAIEASDCVAALGDGAARIALTFILVCATIRAYAIASVTRGTLAGESRRSICASRFFRKAGGWFLQALVDVCCVRLKLDLSILFYIFYIINVGCTVAHGGKRLKAKYREVSEVREKTKLFTIL